MNKEYDKSIFSKIPSKIGDKEYSGSGSGGAHYMSHLCGANSGDGNVFCEQRCDVHVFFDEWLFLVA